MEKLMEDLPFEEEDDYEEEDVTTLGKDVITLLHAAAARPIPAVISALSTLPAANNVTATDALQMGLTLIRQGALGVSELCQLPVLRGLKDFCCPGCRMAEERDREIDWALEQLVNAAVEEATLLPTSHPISRDVAHRVAALSKALQSLLLLHKRWEYGCDNDIACALHKALLHRVDERIVVPLVKHKGLDMHISFNNVTGQLKLVGCSGRPDLLELYAGALAEGMEVADEWGTEEHLITMVCDLKLLPALEVCCKASRWRCNVQLEVLQEALKLAVQLNNHRQDARVQLGVSARALQLLCQTEFQCLQMSQADIAFSPASAAAVAQNDAAAVELLLSGMQSAGCCSAYYIAPLLHLAVECGAQAALDKLCCLPEAQDVGRDHLRSLQHISSSTAPGLNLGQLAQAAKEAAAQAKEAVTERPAAQALGTTSTGWAAKAAEWAGNLHDLMCWQALGLPAVREASAQMGKPLLCMLLEETQHQPKSVAKLDRDGCLTLGLEKQHLKQLMAVALPLGNAALVKKLFNPLPSWFSYRWIDMDTTAELLLTAVRLCGNPLASPRQASQWGDIIDFIIQDY
eukprot:gene14832-15017_t